MIQFLFPDEDHASAYDVPYDRLYSEGIRGLIFDIDNTLVPHGAPADRRSIDLFRRLHAAGFKTCLISNNDERRVKPFADAVHSQFKADAAKPLPGGYKAAMNIMGTGKAETAFIGDQIFTDIAGAKLAGIKAILVRPVAEDHEWQIVLKRKLEKPVIALYQRLKKA